MTWLPALVGLLAVALFAASIGVQARTAGYRRMGREAQEREARARRALAERTKGRR